MTGPCSLRVTKRASPLWEQKLAAKGCPPDIKFFENLTIVALPPQEVTRRRQNLYALNSFPVIRTKMFYISGKEVRRVSGNRGEQYWSVFFREMDSLR